MQQVDNTATSTWIIRQNALTSNETVHLLLKAFWEFCAEKKKPLGLMLSPITGVKLFMCSHHLFAILSKIEPEMATGVLIVPLFTTH